MLQPPPGLQGPALDVEVLEGLETFIATEQFLHKLETVSAEWIDLSEHKQAAGSHSSGGVELAQLESGFCQQQPQCPPAEASSQQHKPSSNSSSSPSGLLRRFSWSRSGNSASRSGSIDNSGSNRLAAAAPAAADEATQTGGAAIAAVAAGGGGGAAVGVCSSFEVVEQPPPLHQGSALQEPFVLVSAQDAIDAMAYYIALYLSAAPEARHMDPKQLQAALRQTFTAIRRNRYRAVWDWGRWAYRCTAVSYSALQLYEHPWLVRAVVAAVWTSSKVALGCLV